MVHQCSHCELRFTSTAELDDHLACDHPEFHAEFRTPEDALRWASGRKQPGTARFGGGPGGTRRR